jgi:hypothetical protein
MQIQNLKFLVEAACAPFVGDFCIKVLACDPTSVKLQHRREMAEIEAKPLESAGSSAAEARKETFPTWIKVGAIAAASALAGGLAAAWFYRKTLNTLRQAESDTGFSDFSSEANETDE